jgi:periplasmic divalent cation tolerance protein
MKRNPRILVVLVMCANAAEARKLARRSVEKHLAACGNVLNAKAMSIYRWKGKIERNNEVLLVLKTTRTAFAALQAYLQKLHTYDVPEIIALPVLEALPAYANWVRENVAPNPGSRRRRGVQI